MKKLVLRRAEGPGAGRHGDVLAVSVRGASVACRCATFAELVAYDKANPGKLNVGNSGVGSIQHLLAIVIAKKYGLKWGIVPYRGGAAAIRAVVSNESNVIFNGALATLPFVAQDQLKGIAVSGDKRLPGVPNLPTFKELDMPIVEIGSWQGFLTSKGTPPAMAARLNAEIRKILAMPEITKKIIDLGGDVRTSASPAEFGAWLTKAIDEWGAVVKAERHPGRRVSASVAPPSSLRSPSVASGVSKDGGSLVLRDAQLRCAPQHEAGRELP